MCYEFYRPIMDLNKDLDILYSTCVFCGIQMYTMDALKHKCLKGYTIDDLISYGSLVGPEDAIDKFIRQQEREEPDNEDDTLLEYLDEDAESIFRIAFIEVLASATRTLKSCSSLTQKSPVTNYEAPYNYDGSEDGTCPISQLNYDKSQSVKNYESCNVYPHEKSGSLQSEDTTYAIAEPDKNKSRFVPKYESCNFYPHERRESIPVSSSKALMQKKLNPDQPEMLEDERYRDFSDFDYREGSEDSDNNDVDTQLLALILLHRMKMKRRKNRRFRVHPLWKRRNEMGAHNSLVQEMVLFDHAVFRNYTRMSVQTYEEILSKVGSKLFSAPTRSDTITPSEKLMVTQRYLATGESYTSLSRQFRMGISTIQKFIPETLSILWTTLQPDVLVLPDSEDKWFQIIDDFDKMWQFPNCFGAMDGKQVMMQAQPHSGSDYYNYNNFHSIILLAMCDANYNFLMVDVGAKGRQSDGGVFKNSNFYKNLTSERLNLPPSSPLYPGGPKIPQVYVTDAGFALGKRGMRPFVGVGTGALPKEKHIFNYRLSRARRTIESAFGILVARWRIFRVPIMVKLEMVKLIVQAAVCLHNYIKREEKNLPEDMQHYCPPHIADIPDPIESPLGEWRRNVRRHGFMPTRCLSLNSGTKIRDHLKEYFMGPGKVPWQNKVVAEGHI